MNTANPYWWAQPAATVIAALIALAAAGAAYWSVSRQINANATNIDRQIKAAEAGRVSDRKHELDVMSQDRRLELAVEALQVALDVQDLAFKVFERARDPYAPPVEAEELNDSPVYLELWNRSWILAERLRLMEMTRTADAVSAASATIGKVSGDSGSWEAVLAATDEINVSARFEGRPSFVE